ncbi:MAG: capsular polysaccharide synthesis protein [Kiritimatiellia bacterium]
MLDWLYRLFLCTVRPALHRLGLDLVWYRKDSQDEAWARVLRYRDLAESSVRPAQPETGEKTIWQFWWQGEENAPELVRHCLASVRKFAPAGWRVVVIDESTVERYVAVPDCIRSKHLSGTISHTHFSDWLRVGLLARHGGIWIVATVLLTGSVPAEVLNARFFMFKSSLWADAAQIPTVGLLPCLSRTAGRSGLGGGESAGSNWFLASTGGSAILGGMVRLLESYWASEDSLCDYFFFHKFLSLLVAADDTCRREYAACPTRVNVDPHLLQFSLNRPYDAELWQRIRARTTIHKLTHKTSQPYAEGTFGALATKGALS